MSAAEYPPLASYQWRYRLLLVHAPDRTEAVASILKEEAPALRERDMRIVALSGEAPDHPLVLDLSEEDRERCRHILGAAPPVFVLIGKDGGEKLRQETLNLPEIRARIDAMPMRQREMRRRSDRGQ